jgi:hypothetical protein
MPNFDLIWLEAQVATHILEASTSVAPAPAAAVSIEETGEFPEQVNKGGFADI